MNLEILSTVVAEDGLSYVDFQKVNGIFKTVLFVKKEEPNLFESVFELTGDHIADIREKHEMEKSK